MNAMIKKQIEILKEGAHKQALILIGFKSRSRKDYSNHLENLFKTQDISTDRELVIKIVTYAYRLLYEDAKINGMKAAFEMISPDRRETLKH